MKIGKIVYCYYDDVVPCQKAKILETYPDCSRVAWLDSKNRAISSSLIEKDKIFKTKKQCLNYAKTLTNKTTDELRSKLLTKEDVLVYMFNSIQSEDSDCSSKKEVLREKILELFGIKLT